MTYFKLVLLSLLCWWGTSAFGQENRPAPNTVATQPNQNIAKQLGFLPEQELLNKRDISSKHFLMPNGEIKAVLGSGALHYWDNGNWQDISTAITTTKDGTYPYANATNILKSYYGATSQTGIISVTDEGSIKEFVNVKMGWENNGNQLGSVTIGNAPASASNNTLTYANAFNGIDVEFTQTAGGRKLNYIINNRNALNNAPLNADQVTFSEDIEIPAGFEYEISEKGITISKAGSSAKYIYALPMIMEAYSQGGGLLSDAPVSYEFTRNGNTLTYKIIIEKSWLLDPARQYPIAVDPTSSYYPNGSTARTGYANGSGSGAYGNIICGYASVFYVGYSTFDISTIPSGVTISTINLNVTFYGATSMGIGRGVNVDAFLADPESYTSWGQIYSAVINATNAPYGYTSQAGANGAYNLYLGTDANTVLTSAMPNGIFTVGYIPYGSYSSTRYIRIYGDVHANQPYITVTYTNASACAAGTATLANAGYIFAPNTANLTLAGNGGSTVQWQSSANGTTGWASVTGGTGATTTNYTTGSLAEGTYYYRAAVTDGGSCVEYSNVVTVTVEPEPFHSDDFSSSNGWTVQTALSPYDAYQETRWLITGCAGNTIDGTPNLQVVARDNFFNPATVYCGNYYSDFIVSGMTARKQITDAANYTDMTLYFDWKCVGERDAFGFWDYGEVGYSLDGVNYTWMNSAVSGASGHGYNNQGKYVSTAAVTSAKIPLPAALDNQPFYVAFRWFNDGNTGFTPAFTIDNINIVGTPTPFTCATVTGLSAAIGSPANGTEHHLDVTWDAVTGATGYDLDYSTSSSSGPWNSLGTVTGSSYDFNAGDNPNTPYYFRIRARYNSTTCNYAATATPRYTAADVPALPTLGNVGSTIDVTLANETPVNNPASTTYSIKDENTGLFVQANGTLGATEVFRTKAQWGTVTVNGLSSNTQYCFVAKARNNDGHEVGGSGATLLAAQAFNTSGTLSTSSGSGSTASWWSPSSCGSGGLGWNASNGCTGGAVGQSTTTPFCFVRSPAVNCVGQNTVVMTFDISHSYFASLTTDQVNFNMWAPTASAPTGQYIDAAKVNGVAGDILYFNQARSCQQVTVEYDLSLVTDKSAVLFYFNTYRPGSSSNTYYMWVDNVKFSEASQTACATTTNCVAGTWTGLAGDNDWNNPANWSCNTIPTATIDVNIPAGVSTYPVLATALGNPTIGYVRDITIAANASVTISGGGNTLEVNRNLTNNGPANLGSGALRLTNAATHTVNGNLNIGTLTVEANTAINNALNITEALNLVAGVLNTNSGTVTLKSNASTTAYIDDFSAGHSGSISGNVTVERYVANTVNGFHYVGTPVNGANFGDWAADFTIYGSNNAQVIPQANCDPNALAQGSPYGGLFDYRENTVTDCYLSGWHVRNGNGNISRGQGFAGIIPNGRTIDLTGAANTGNISSGPLTRSGNNITSTQGMHLISNPYPSALDWYDVAAANSGVDGTAYLWLTSGGYQGTYQPINALAPNSSFIGSSQGFFVEALSNGTQVNFNNTMRVTGNNSFFRQGQAFDSRLILEVSGNGYNDMTIVAFGNDFTHGYDRDFDGKKMQSKAGVMTLYTHTNNSYPRQSTNALPNDRSVKVVPVGFAAGANGTFTFNATDLGTFAPGTLIFLEDLKTGHMQNLMLDAQYTFQGDKTDGEARFLLYFIPGIEWNTVAASCTGNDGSLVVDLGASQMNGIVITWDNYEIVNQNGNEVATGHNANGTINLSNLAPGTYTVTLQHDGYTVVQEITVTGAPLVDATAALSDTEVTVGEIIAFTNNSQGATSYAWDFGDGNTSTDANPAYSYTAEGTYTVTLTATNGTCTDVYTQTIVVAKVQDPTGIVELADGAGLQIFGYGRTITVRFENWKDGEAMLELYDLTGRKVIDTQTLNTAQAEHRITVDEVVTGYYFVRVSGASGSQVARVFLGE